MSSQSPTSLGCEELSLASDLGCQCDDSAGTITVHCDVDLEVLDISLTADFHPCNSVPSITFDVTAAGYDAFHEEVHANGETQTVPIPGMDISVGFASAQIQLDLTLQGSSGELDIDLGVDACASVIVLGKECGADIPDLGLPVSIVKGNYNFSPYCATFDGTQSSQLWIYVVAGGAGVVLLSLFIWCCCRQQNSTKVTMVGFHPVVNGQTSAAYVPPVHRPRQSFTELPARHGPQALEAGAAPPTMLSTAPYCSSCGSRMTSATAQFCSSCGTKKAGF